MSRGHQQKRCLCGILQTESSVTGASEKGYHVPNPTQAVVVSDASSQHRSDDRCPDPSQELPEAVGATELPSWEPRAIKEIVQSRNHLDSNEDQDRLKSEKIISCH
jgi:hypothetical protein